MRRFKVEKLILIISFFISFLIYGCSDNLINNEKSAEFIKIEPHTVVLVPNEKKQFFAMGINKNGDEFVLPEVKWDVDSGKIDGNGVYTAPNSKTVALISATYNDIHGKVAIEVKQNIEGDSLEIRIGGTGNLTVGQKYVARAFLKLKNGGEIEVKPKWDSGIGTIDKDGLYSAPVRSIRDRIIATYKELKCVKSFELKPEGPILIWIKPSRVEIKPSEGVQFTTYGVDRFNNIFPMGASFRTDSGIINSRGFYRPSSTTTNAKVWAEVGNISGLAEVRVKF